MFVINYPFNYSARAGHQGNLPEKERVLNLKQTKHIYVIIFYTEFTQTKNTIYFDNKITVI
jgi:hypothetical protein